MLLILLLLTISLHSYAMDKEVAKSSEIKIPDDHVFDPYTALKVMQEQARGQVWLKSNGSLKPEEPAFTLAVERLMPKTCEHLLKISGIQVNEKDFNGFTPLHCAMVHMRNAIKEQKENKEHVDDAIQKHVDGNVEKCKAIIHMIIEHETFDPHQFAKEKNGITKKVEITYPLNWAAECKCFDFIPLLSKKNSTKYTPIFLKKVARHMDKVGPEIQERIGKEKKSLKKVMIHSVDKKVTDQNRMDEIGITESLQFLVTTYKPSQKLRDQTLYHALKARNLTDSKWLIESANATCNYYSPTETWSIALAKNSWYGDTHILDKLIPLILKKNAYDAEKQVDNKGNTPFHYLAKRNAYNKVDLTKSFEKLGISHDAKNNKGETACYYQNNS